MYTNLGKDLLAIWQIQIWNVIQTKKLGSDLAGSISFCFSFKTSNLVFHLDFSQIWIQMIKGIQILILI